MTYKELAEVILSLTPEQLNRPAVIAMQQTGEVAEVKSLDPIETFNGTELKDQHVISYDARKDPNIF